MDAPAAVPSSPVLREPTTGAWWGLALVLYGCTSVVLCGAVVAASSIAPPALDTFLLEQQNRHAEGLLSQLCVEQVEAVSRHVADVAQPVMLHAVASGLLALLVIVGGYGVCLRRPGGLTLARIAVAGKVALTLGGAVAASVWLEPELRSILAEGQEAIQMLNGRGGADEGVSQIQRTMETLGTVVVACGVVSVAIAALAVTRRSVARWCSPPEDRRDPAPESGVASNGPRG